MRLELTFLLLTLILVAVVESRRPRYAPDRRTRRTIPGHSITRDMKRARMTPQWHRVRRQSGDCDTMCTQIFIAEDFQTCSNLLNVLLSGDTSAGTASGADYCDQGCPDIVAKGLDCIEQYCTGDNGPGDLSPIKNVNSASCSRSDSTDGSHNYCFDDYLKLERDIQDRTLEQAFETCGRSNTCDDCSTAYEYLAKNDGCCYATYYKFLGTFINGVLVDPEIAKGCGENILANKCADAI